ncbi:MAG: molybdopterin-dependent oxidoreductase [Anaerolineales bacterium]|nr:molybdopterin-dependent oxidoreductase [Anaerolineales bacterium]
MYKKLFFGLIILALLSAGCAAKESSAPVASGDQLKVGDGATTKEYTAADLQALTESTAAFKDVTYKGVTLKALIADAGFNFDEIKAVKAVAADGFSSNYDSSIYSRDDVIVAYATESGALTEDDGVFRMVIPDGEGKQNVRMLAEIKIVK